VKLTRTSAILAIIGVLLLASAAVVRWVVLPSVSQLPEDFSSSQDYEGTYSGLNQAALAGGAGDVLVEGVPVSATRTYETDSVEGDTSVITQTIERTIGGQSSTTEVKYAVDRETFESTDPPSGAEDVVDSEGLIFSLPVDPQTDGDYRLWDASTQAAYPLTYEGESTLGDRAVYEYRSVADGELADPAALGLPTEIPRPLLTTLGPALAEVLPPEVLAQLPVIIAQLPATLPVSYTSSTTSTVFADQEIGATISSGSTQEITAQLALGPQTIEVPFSTIELTATDDSIAARADDTADKASSLNLVGTILPMALAALGVLLVIVAIVLAVRAGRGGQGSATVDESGRTPAGV
jgi:hypothetical protein